MTKVTVQEIQGIGGARFKVQGVVVFGGGRETLNPTDVKLKTIDFIQLTGMNRSAGFPIGSMSFKGSPGITGSNFGVLEGRGGALNVGSAVTLIWRVGSGPGDTGFGSVGVGSKTALFTAFGEV